ncbi:MAG TPA: arsenate reductase ArsC [Nitrosopumilaceae archaeon]|nr:arsenate reductase ArsC [Nitrosopumilaceae archaeon]
MSETKKILFVCVENAGRSQIAEGFFRKYATSEYQPISAGTQPVSETNPLAIKAMKEVGIDISKQIPKTISEEMMQKSTKIINMGCMDKESCPALFLDNVIDWKIPDPKGKSIDEVRKIRDQIEVKVKELVKNLER